MRKTKLATFVISLDTELAWGSVDDEKSLSKRIPLFRQTSHIIDDLLRLFEVYQIRATWAIVGQLYVGHFHCSSEDGKGCGKSNSDIASSHVFNEKSPREIWFLDDIVERILGSAIEHEIASHSFSHLIFGSGAVSRDVIERELELSVHYANQKNLTLESFVFPRNSVAYLDLLKKYGFKCFRGEDPYWYNRFPHILRKALHMMDQLLSVPPPLIVPSVCNGLTNVPGSMLFLSRDGIRRLIPISSRVKKALRGIDKVINNGGIFHLWFHPFNLATDSRRLLPALEIILSKVRTEVEKGNIQVKTMREITS